MDEGQSAQDGVGSVAESRPTVFPERNTEPWREEIVAAYVAGEPTLAIAARFKIGSSFAGQLARRAGVRLRGGGPTWKRRLEATDPWDWRRSEK